jgi:hypothetical protein
MTVAYKMATSLDFEKTKPRPYASKMKIIPFMGKKSMVSKDIDVT